jgi:hypothetical protein
MLHVSTATFFTCCHAYKCSHPCTARNGVICATQALYPVQFGARCLMRLLIMQGVRSCAHCCGVADINLLIATMRRRRAAAAAAALHWVSHPSACTLLLVCGPWKPLNSSHTAEVHPMEQAVSTRSMNWSNIHWR